jgi:hypothetical protein
MGIQQPLLLQALPGQHGCPGAPHVAEPPSLPPPLPPLPPLPPPDFPPLLLQANVREMSAAKKMREMKPGGVFMIAIGARSDKASQQ